MTIHAYILCWNEQDMIRHTLNHYNSFCDKIFIMDNQSTDQTPEIIKNECPAAMVLPYSSRNQLSDAHYLKLKNRVWKRSRGLADWVIVCDADEFLYHPDGLRQELGLRLKNQEHIPSVRGFNMISGKFPADFTKPIYEQVKYGIRAANFDKLIVFNPNQVIDINYGPGAHSASPVLKSRGTIDPHPLNLLHFKYMGRSYLKKRHAMYALRMSHENRKMGYGAEYLKGEAFVDECFDTFKQPEFKPVRVVP